MNGEMDGLQMYELKSWERPGISYQQGRENWMVFVTAQFWKWTDRWNILRFFFVKMTWNNIGKILLPYQWHFLSLFDKLLKYVVS